MGVWGGGGFELGVWGVWWVKSKAKFWFFVFFSCFLKILTNTNQKADQNLRVELFVVVLIRGLACRAVARDILRALHEFLAANALVVLFVVQGGDAFAVGRQFVARAACVKFVDVLVVWLGRFLDVFFWVASVAPVCRPSALFNPLVPGVAPPAANAVGRSGRLQSAALVAACVAVAIFPGLKLRRSRQDADVGLVEADNATDAAGAAAAGVVLKGHLGHDAVPWMIDGDRLLRYKRSGAFPIIFIWGVWGSFGGVLGGFVRKSKLPSKKSKQA